MRLEDGRAIVTLKLKEDAVPVYRDASVLLRPKTGLKDMVAELTPGHARRRRAPAGRADPDRADRAGRQPRRDPRVARRRHADLPAAAAVRGRPGARRQLARARQHDPPLRADRALHRADRREAREAAARTSAASSTTSRSWSRSSAAATTSSADFVSSSNAVFASLARQDASLRATLQELPSTLTATQSALTDTKALADVLGPTLAGPAARRPRARPGAGRDAAVPDATRRR